MIDGASTFAARVFKRCFPSHERVISPRRADDRIDRSCRASRFLRCRRLKGFLTSAKAEITRMRVTEYDEKETLALEREEGREEGRAEGRVEGRVEGRIEALKAAAKNLHNQGCPVEKIASAFDASVVDVKIWLNDVE